jgi:heme a synthase
LGLGPTKNYRTCWAKAQPTNKTGLKITVLSRLIKPILLFTICLALTVIVLGAYTRLKDAGLGCPDWPGCYGQISAPKGVEEVKLAESIYPDTPVEYGKAMTEMVHRYFAGTLGLCIFIISGLLFKLSRTNNKQYKAPFKISLILSALVIFQAMLGMWTVTLKLLPIIVTSHLLCGLLTLSLLWLVYLKVSNKNLNSGSYFKSSIFNLKPLAFIALVVLFLQIGLGGWTSANYAALICPDFPYCQGSIIPNLDIPAALNLLHGIDNLDNPFMSDNTAKMTVHMLHRFGAILSLILLTTLSILLFKRSKELESKFRFNIRVISGLLLILLITQATLGVLNIVMLLPIHIAVTHNFIAALLLLTTITAFNKVSEKYIGVESGR